MGKHEATPRAKILRPNAGAVLFALILWLLVSGRWGSYVGLSNFGLFLTDVVVLVSAVALLTGGPARDLVNRLRRPPLLVALCVGLLVLAVIRLALSDGSPLTMLRDFAPYGYAGVALLAYLAPVPAWGRSVLVVMVALAVHTLIVANSSWEVLSLDGLPVLGGAPIFTVRGDYDLAVCGVTAAAALHAVIYRRQGKIARGLLLGLATLSGAAVLAQPSRAGLIAALATIAAVLAVPICRRHRIPPAIAFGGAGGLLLLAVAVLTLTTPGQRLTNGFIGEGDGSGTVRARKLVYERVIDYNLAETGRAALGVGFGPDFLTASGGVVPLAGTRYEGVRSPHQYLLGTWSRLGLPGVLLASAIIVVGLMAAIRTLRADATVTDVVAAGCLIALPIAAQLGVVLEAPFGAVPYFWAAGYVSRKRRLGRAVDDSQSPRPVTRFGRASGDGQRAAR